MALPSAKLSDFRLGGRLGNGASARVYDAIHVATGLPVALKVLADHALLEGHGVRERFAREALLLAAVESRYVNKILGYGFERGRPFLVLERLHGETLDAKLRRDGPVPSPIAARWVEQLILGVRDCHAAQIIHRDIKPSNLFLHRDGSGAEAVRLIDFGVARLMQLTGGTALTSPGDLIGSMGYMAPEQFERAEAVVWPADLYAIGVVVFRMFTGRLPFISRSIEAAIRMKMDQPTPLVSAHSHVKSAALDAFVVKAMARDPAARFQSAREMLDRWSAIVAALEETDADALVTTRRMGRVHVCEDGTLLAPDSDLPPTAVVEEEITLSRSRAIRPEGVREQVPRTRPSEDLGRGDTVTQPTAPLPTPSEPDPFELETRNDPDLGRRIRQHLEQLELDPGRRRE